MPPQYQNAVIWIFMTAFGWESGRPCGSLSRWQTSGRKEINGITV